MEPEDMNLVSARGNAPVDDVRTARVIEREEQVEQVTDVWGAQITRRLIRSRILEVECKRAGDHNDIARLEDDAMVERFLALQHHG